MIRMPELLLAMALMAPLPCRAEPMTPAPGTQLRKSILDVAREPAEQQLSREVRFRVRRLAVDGPWAFLFAEMQGPDGKPVDYAGTPLAQAAREGVVSRAFAALLRRDGARWRIAASAVGPTDVAWQDWSQKYGTPAQLFNGAEE